MRRLWQCANSADIQLLQGVFIVLEQEPILCIEKPLVMSEYCWEEGPKPKTFQLFQLSSLALVLHYSVCLCEAAKKKKLHKSRSCSWFGFLKLRRAQNTDSLGPKFSTHNDIVSLAIPAATFPSASVLTVTSVLHVDFRHLCIGYIPVISLWSSSPQISADTLTTVWIPNFLSSRKRQDNSKQWTLIFYNLDFGKKKNPNPCLLNIPIVQPCQKISKNI